MHVRFEWLQKVDQTPDWSSTGWVVVAALLMLCSVIALIRIVGLRSLAKMSGFDFAVTVAIGSILGSSVASTTSVVRGVTAIASLLGLQWVIAQLRRRSRLSRVIDNRPVVLVRDGVFDGDALTRSRVTRDDVLARLRQANVRSLGTVNAVVLETTGDLSVLHGHAEFDEGLLDGVKLEASA